MSKSEAHVEGPVKSALRQEHAHVTLGSARMQNTTMVQGVSGARHQGTA